ncbi:hypothetical protein IGI04_001030 [Brassica rapa subsp. trilocularis]|uniref:Uncharacterized protein n=1 Tax=Brassica rapa subsp. trilocularis TaxID=1813537 RepID=A0ABQ7NRG8_BRACM|nr:hypothetical protein IGI04_001030 [Brassica rapa subsp. trilocularis]
MHCAPDHQPLRVCGTLVAASVTLFSCEIVDDNGEGETVVIRPSPNDEDSNKNVRTKTAEAWDKNTHLRKMPKPFYILLNLSNIFLLSL